jgi:hypothetical protein
MSAPEPLTALSRAELLVGVAELPRQMSALQRHVAELAASNETLRAESEQLKRSGKRQAAPFSQGTREPEPKRPGRKPGSGTFRCREAPPPKPITEPPVDVKVPHDASPACGGELVEERVDFACHPELPELPRPQVPRSRVWVCRCLCAAPGCEGNIRTWPRTKMARPPTGWGRG